MGVCEERLPRLSREALLAGRARRKKPVESRIGASDNPLSIEVPLSATNEEEVDGLVGGSPSAKASSSIDSDRAKG